MQQNVTMVDEIPEVIAIVNSTVYFPNDDVLGGEIARLQASSATYQAALQEVQSRRLQARADSPPFGWTTKDDSVLGDQVQTLTFIQDLGSDGGEDLGLLGFVARGFDETGRPIRQEYFELVSKPSAGVTDLSDIKTVATFRDGAKVAGNIQPFSIFSRFIKCVRNSCAGTCLGALTACAGVFPVYLKCVIVACGGCAVKCGACAGCDCGFWCRWAVGCCRD
jgi:hypothetical protein